MCRDQHGGHGTPARHIVQVQGKRHMVQITSGVWIMDFLIPVVVWNIFRIIEIIPFFKERKHWKTGSKAALETQTIFLLRN